MRQIIIVYSIILSSLVHAQQLDISEITVDKGIVSFVAFITESHSSREVYDLSIFTSADQFQKPIDYIKSGLKSGIPYNVSFDANQYVGTYDGQIQFKFEIDASNFPIRLTKSKSFFRRGKSVNLQWQDFNKEGSYSVTLWKNDQPIQTFGKGISTTETTFRVPKSLGKGKGCFIQIASESDPQKNSEMIPITIKGKHGLFVKLLPLVVLGGSVPFVLQMSSGTENNTLADPPGPPSQTYD